MFAELKAGENLSHISRWAGTKNTQGCPDLSVFMEELTSKVRDFCGLFCFLGMLLYELREIKQTQDFLSIITL